MLRNYLIGAWRTTVTAGLGWIAAWLAARGFELSTQTQLEIVGGTMVVLYLILAALEKKWPKAGWLLGWGASPEYAKREVQANGFEEPSRN